MMKSILLVHGSMSIGGVETLILRLANAWSQKGVQVKVLLLTNVADKGLLIELEKYAVVIYLRDILKYKFIFFNSLPMLNIGLPLSKKKVAKLLHGIEHIHFTDSLTMLFCAFLCRANNSSLKVSGGVYHQYEYAYPRLNRSRYVCQLEGLFKTVIPSDSIIFFNEVSRKNLTEISGVDFSRNLVLPIGIDLSKYGMRDMCGIDRLKIVSVGRLTGFKTYNFQLIKSLETLKEFGVEFSYHIYGDGPLKESLEKTVSISKVSEQIFIYGSLNYSSFKDVIADAAVFIGSGTALIEAAACGVPGIIGIEAEDSTKTYGYFHKMQGFSYQEKGLDYSTDDYHVYLNDLLKFTDSEYKNLCKLSHEKSTEFSIAHLIDGFDKFHDASKTTSFDGFKISKVLFFIRLIFDRIFFNKRPNGFWQRYNLK